MYFLLLRKIKGHNKNKLLLLPVGFSEKYQIFSIKIEFHGVVWTLVLEGIENFRARKDP